MPIIRVLHLRNCRGITTLTGPETYLLDLLAGIDPQRFDVTLGCVVNPARPAHVFLDALAERRIVCRRIDLPSRFSVGDLRWVRALQRAGPLDVLHTHDSRSDFIGWLAGAGTGVPRVCFAHGWLNWARAFSKERLYAALEFFAVTRAHHIIVASESMRRELLGHGLPAGRISLIPYGIDTHRFHVAPPDPAFRAELGIPLDALLIGTVGRLHPWKGHRYLLEAAPDIVRRHRRAHFLFVGDAAFSEQSEFRRELRDLARSLGVESRVTWAGTRSDMPRVMQALDLFVFPSLREPFGIVLIEAQACGKPVIGTRVGGIPEALRDGETGVLVEPADSAGLARAMLEMLDHPERLQSMGAAGRRFVESTYSVEAMVARTERLYEEMAVRGRAGRAGPAGGAS